MYKTIFSVLCTILSVSTFNGMGQTIPFPPRQDHFLTGSRFAEKIRDLEPEEREIEIIGQFTMGNVPYFLRKTIPVTITGTIRGIEYLLTCHVLPDYLAIGSDEDYFLVPMTPGSAQEIADIVKKQVSINRHPPVFYIFWRRGIVRITQVRRKF